MRFRQTYFYKVLFLLYYLPRGLFWRCVFAVARWLELLRCIYAALKARRLTLKPFDIGLGNLPLINNVYHKQALVKYGYTVNTFVYNTYFITSDFDFNADKEFTTFQKYRRYYSTWFKYIVNNHKCLYFYFNGCVLGASPYLYKYEAWLLKLARVKTVVMPYGADVQDFTKSTNLLFRNAMCTDYPKFHLERKKIAQSVEMWTTHADHIIAGCDWVEYLYHWDTLTLAHFSIDVDKWKPQAKAPADENPDRPLKIFHAPNHKTVKGTKHFIRAIEELQREGLNIELVIKQKVPNEEIRKAIEEVDIVADQLIVGWYAMFALEAMSLGKPLLCYLNPQLVRLYTEAGLVEHDEIPIINCDPFTVKDRIRYFYNNRHELKEIGKRSRAYIVKHHSTDYIGSVFHKINQQIGVSPTGQATIN